MTFVDFVGSQGLLRDPNGSHFGSLRGQICDPDSVQVPRWLPGPQKEPFGVTLGDLLEVF